MLKNPLVPPNCPLPSCTLVTPLPPSLPFSHLLPTHSLILSSFQVLWTLGPESLGVSVVRAAGALLSARHGAERLNGCWHGGSMSLEQVKAQIKVRAGRLEGLQR